MIFKSKKHTLSLYNILLHLSRNIFFYDKIRLPDNFETRIYLMFIHFSILMIIFKKKRKKFDQNAYDQLFHNIENNLRELGFGDVSVNKKMKELNKVLYDILLKLELNIIKVFTPEHGFRGEADAGADIENEIDEKTGLSIISASFDTSLDSKSIKGSLPQIARACLVIMPDTPVIKPISFSLSLISKSICAVA